MAKKGRKGSRKARKSYKDLSSWTPLEKGFAAAIVVLLVVAAYAFYVNEEIVEVGSIETYNASVDLRAGHDEFDEYRFNRQLKRDYQFTVKYTTVDEGGSGDRPPLHFKVWNSTTKDVLIPETTQNRFEDKVRVEAGEAGYYDFVWWVPSGSGVLRVDIDVLIQPTEKLFEKRT